MLCTIVQKARTFFDVHTLLDTPQGLGSFLKDIFCKRDFCEPPRSSISNNNHGDTNEYVPFTERYVHTSLHACPVLYKYVELLFLHAVHSVARSSSLFNGNSSEFVNCTDNDNDSGSACPRLTSFYFE